MSTYDNKAAGRAAANIKVIYNRSLLTNPSPGRKTQRVSHIKSFRFYIAAPVGMH